jgi:acetylornithine deacetylase/succinyl-diaminopimelate desuccinylase-like protein
MIGRIFGAALALASSLGLTQSATAQDRPDQVRFHEVYKELVETNTSLSVGSCTVAAAKMGARLKAAGFPDADLTYFSVADHPKEGGLVAILHGSSKTAKPMLLLGHLDVVEAKRADWTRDPSC